MISPTVSADSGAAVDLPHRNYTHPSSLGGPSPTGEKSNRGHHHSSSSSSNSRSNNNSNSSSNNNNNHSSSNNNSSNDHSNNDDDVVLSEYTAQLIIISFLVKRVSQPLMEQLRRRLFAMELGTCHPHISYQPYSIVSPLYWSPNHSWSN